MRPWLRPLVLGRGSVARGCALWKGRSRLESPCGKRLVARHIQSVIAGVNPSSPHSLARKPQPPEKNPRCPSALAALQPVYGRKGQDGGSHPMNGPARARSNLPAGGQRKDNDVRVLVVE